MIKTRLTSFWLLSLQAPFGVTYSRHKLMVCSHCPTQRPRQTQIQTRMHSSRMRTGRSLTVCQSVLPGGGGVCSQGGVCSHGRGGIPACTEADTPPPVQKYNLGHNFVAAGNNLTQNPMGICVGVCLCAVWTPHHYSTQVV